MPCGYSLYAQDATKADAKVPNLLASDVSLSSQVVGALENLSELLG
jgi:hypothetical protein